MSHSQNPIYRVSVDTGGTFTDGFVTSGERSAQIKVDTTPYDPTVGFGACIAAAAEAMDEELPAFLARARMIHFSSTIATNAVVQRQGARIGLIVTAGNERLLYGDEEQVANLASFIPGDAVRGVAEAVDADGRVTAEVDESALQAAVRELLETGVQVVVVSFANAHLNPANEARAQAMVEDSYPRHYLGAIPLLLSSQLSLTDDDHGRTALAVANAYLHPFLARSLYRAEDLLRRQGFVLPLQIVNTNGSSARVAKTRAIDTFNSGPTAGTLGAAIVAEALQAEHVVTFDVGGTTTDVAYIAGATVPRAGHTAFGPVNVPHEAVGLWSFGIGGGSLITVDETTDELTVGPRSAGAVPGPACFGLGGDRVTPTDVWLTLGYLEPGEFLSGRRTLDVARAREAVGRLAEQLGLPTVDEAALAAYAAIRTVIEKDMRDWAASHPALMAAAPRQRWLFSYGGGGGLLAAQAAEALDIDNIAVFPQSSVFSAFGGGLLPIAHSYEAAVLDVADPKAVIGAVRGLIDRACRDLRAEGVPQDTEVTARCRLSGFRGGAVDLPAGSLRTLGERIEGIAAQLDNGSGAGSGAGRIGLGIEVPREIELRVRLETAGAGGSATRRICSADGAVDVRVVSGLGRPGADPASGPAFLDALDTTIFVPGGWDVEFNDLGYGLLRRNAHHG